MKKMSNNYQGLLIALNIITLLVISIIISYITRISVKESFDQNHHAPVPLLDLKYEPSQHGKIPTLLDNPCNPTCCSVNNTYTCSTGCVCLSEEDKKLIYRE